MMDKVEGLMRRMQLSAAEKKGIRITSGGLDAGEEGPPQAFGKLFSEKRGRASALEMALTQPWCPRDRLECKELGDNKFLFTFHQASGKRKALEDGPWNLSDELLVMVDVDDSKTLDEIEFNEIPCWVRIMKLPLGMMNRSTAEALGKEIGKFVEADVGRDGKVVGSFLRVKVRLDIRVPLMRGITILVGKEGQEVNRWCPLQYEFLPDFCYICGLLGHTDRLCDKKLLKGEVKQFDGSIRFTPQKGRLEHNGRSGGQQWQGGWLGNRSAGSGGGGRLSWEKSRSDSDSWRKGALSGANKKRVDEKEGEEVTSPLKIKEGKSGDGQVEYSTAKKVLFSQDKGILNSKSVVDEGGKGEERSMLEVTKVHASSTMQAMQEDMKAGKMSEGEGSVMIANNGKSPIGPGNSLGTEEQDVPRKKTYKKVQRNQVREKGEGKMVGGSSRKRAQEDVVMEEADGGKRSRLTPASGEETTVCKNDAELPGQLCENQ